MYKLRNLLALNKGRGFFKAESSTEEATVYLYDTISSDAYWGGVSALDFAKTLASISAPVIHLRINSPGGDVFAARAMVQAMKDHSSKVIAHVDGLAASAATFLVVAADESVISNGAGFMIHNAWTIAAGNAKDLTETATLLSRVDKTIVTEYANKTGLSQEEIANLMDAETYYFGGEAVDAGFVDSIAEAMPKNQINWDLSAYGLPDQIQDEEKTPVCPAVDPHNHDDEAIRQQVAENRTRLKRPSQKIQPA